MREAGNVIGALILTALIAAKLAGEPPLTVKAISAQLKLPAETVRRHTLQMVEDGLCVRAATGLTLTDEHLGRRGLQLLLADNAMHVQRLLSGLAERGVILSWQAPVDHADRGAA
jgi:DNA-binding IclR family transcriptional regulator